MPSDERILGSNITPTKKQIRRWLSMVNCSDCPTVITHGESRLKMFFRKTSDAEKFVQQNKLAP